MDPPKVRSTRRGRTDYPLVKEDEAVFQGGEGRPDHDVGNQIGSITSTN